MNTSIQVNDVSSASSEITESCTVRRSVANNSELDIKKRLLAVESDEDWNDIVRSIPIIEAIKGFRDNIRDTYPTASAAFLVFNKVGNDLPAKIFNFVGNAQDIGKAFAHGMSYSEDAIKIFNETIKAYYAEAGKKKCDVEQLITSLKDIITSLERSISPETRILLLKNEVKRLRQANRTDLMRQRQADLDAVCREQEESRRRAARMKELASQRLEWLRKGRETQARLREEKRIREEAARHQQPNFAKMAKRKRQQIAARKAEKKKKKASGSESFSHSCSQLLSR